VDFLVVLESNQDWNMDINILLKLFSIVSGEKEQEIEIEVSLMDWERRDDWNKSGREGQRENMNRSLREYESDCRLGERWVAGSETVAGESDCR
jgi:hypothetical protein